MPRTSTVQRPAGVVARLRSRLQPAAETPAPEPAHSRRQDALAVLTATRGVVQRGWTQHSWYVTQTPTGRRRSAQRFFPGKLDHASVVEACLVGAVMHAAWQQSPQADHGYPAIDALWHALFDIASPAGDPVGPVCPPMVRAARVRDLTTWNDRYHRTRDEVIRLLDRATARLSATETPARA